MGCASSRPDGAVDSKKEHRSSTTVSAFTDISSVECNTLPAPMQPSIWVRATALDALPPQPPVPVEKGSLVSVRGIPGHADGTGAEVLSVTDSGELELRLEDASAADAPLRVSAANTMALPAFPAEGVSFACLRAFREAHASQLYCKTTEEVCVSVIKPIASRARASLAEVLLHVNAADPVTGRPFVGRATLFVSHAWKYRFTDLLDALEAHICAMPEPDLVYVWLDTFVVNQHASMDKPKIWWTVTFREAIRSIGATCLVLAPWNAPIPLARAWCIWEIASVVLTDTALDVALAPTQAAAFEKALVEDFGSIATSLSRVDVRNAEAFILADRDMILRVAEETVGLSKLNELVLGRMREWLAGVGKKALARLPDAERGTSRLIVYVSILLKNQGRLDEAEPLCREALEAAREVLGSRHPNTLVSMNNLAMMLSGQGKLDEAEPLYREALEARREVLGARHPDTLGSMHNLGGVLKDQGKLDEAEPLCREALDGYREVLGERHPMTLNQLANWADVLRSRGALEEARAAVSTALVGQRELVGEWHWNVLECRAIQAHINVADPATAAEGIAAMKAAVADMRQHLGAKNEYCRKYEAVLATVLSQVLAIPQPEREYSGVVG